MFKNLIYGVLRWRFYKSLSETDSNGEVFGFKYFQVVWLSKEGIQCFIWICLLYWLLDSAHFQEEESVPDAQYKIVL